MSWETKLTPRVAIVAGTLAVICTGAAVIGARSADNPSPSGPTGGGISTPDQNTRRSGGVLGTAPTFEPTPEPTSAQPTPSRTPSACRLRDKAFSTRRFICFLPDGRSLSVTDIAQTGGDHEVTAYSIPGIDKVYEIPAVEAQSTEPVTRPVTNDCDLRLTNLNSSATKVELAC